MNRRQFTASLGAVATLPLVPFPVKAAAVPATNLPPAAYAWAHFFARAQPSMSAAKLARYLKIDGSSAVQLFNQLICDGVLNAPSAFGTARAIANPTQPNLTQRLQKMAETLAKEDITDLECETAPQETTDASPNEPLQEGPSQG